MTPTFQEAREAHVDYEMTRQSVMAARVRIVEFLSHFSDLRHTEWEAWEHGSDVHFLDLLALDFTMLSLAIEQRRQQLSQSVQDFGS